MERNVLEVNRLSVTFPSTGGEVKAVSDVTFTVGEGKIAGIVGESGCGKSMTARAVMGLIRAPGKVCGDSILLDGTDILRLSEREKRRLRGSKVSMIFQEPMTSLNPVVRVGKQMEEAILLHEKVSRAEALRRSVRILEEVGVADAPKRCGCYPHQLSGGLRQRVMIAMAMVMKPRLLIADEPTTALDVTVEAQILRLMRKLCAMGTSILMISHNLGVIAQVCDEVNVMYAGRIVERADTLTLFDCPLHPYTSGLLGAVRFLTGGRETLETIPGTVPNPKRLPEGCAFSPRCAQAGETCGHALPGLRDVGEGHLVRCHLARKERQKNESDE